MICSGVIALALPRLISSAFALHPQVAYQLSQETKLSTEIYQNAIDDLNLALAWHQSAYQWQEQAYFYLKLYNSQPVQDAEKRREQLNSAQTALSQGLALSPIDPFGWFQLASADKALKKPTDQIIDDLRLSVYAGQVEPELVIARLAFSYSFYGYFNEDLQKQWQKQLLIAWAFKGPELAKFVGQHLEIKPVVLQAFTYSPDDADKFIKTLEIALKKPL